MARIVDLNATRYDWVPLVGGLTTPSGPKVTELTAVTVKALSQYVVTTTNINPTDAHHSAAFHAANVCAQARSHCW